MPLESQIAVRLPAPVAEGLTLLATRNGLRRAELVRDVLGAHLAAQQPQNEARPTSEIVGSATDKPVREAVDVAPD